jgi:hypothetical protein
MSDLDYVRVILWVAFALVGSGGLLVLAAGPLPGRAAAKLRNDRRRREYPGRHRREVTS